ncbi:MAG: Gfo/Idh/MocA family oxidoreductase [Verrucomicrobia subdivision 3 bacterium]|nr:Gfo/Idh/MocA family oxidoreductase [Verrucomicrobiota bacterium]MCC6820477.1 Gfo/Idh/MocA family oxidoreductase [Limisphaerales bacterium]
MNRREFIQRSALGAAGLCLVGCRTPARKISANEKLNLGIIGVAHQGQYDMMNVAGENIVALCDVDDTYLAAAKQKFPGATTYNDFRRLLDQRDIDAVVIATPDHTHAVATAAALRSGRHVYCEKPLTRTISECRIVTELARKQKLITQIGTQIHSGGNYHQVVELIQQGAIGPVHEVHVWVNATYGGKDLPTDPPPVPAGLHYDLWLGPVAARPYHPEYLPASWRNWWAFGGGAIADFGCHFMDLPHWALGLRSPLSVEIVDGPPVHPESTPPWLIVRYEYPAADGLRGSRQLTWYHGGKKPALLPSSLAGKWQSGVLFIGEKGSLLADYTRHVVLRDANFADYTEPQSIGSDFTKHHREWIQGIKTGKPSSSDFAYSGPLTEAALLGNVAFRAGCRIEWDAKHLRAKNCPAAEEFIQHHYRPGWRL